MKLREIGYRIAGFKVVALLMLGTVWAGGIVPPSEPVRFNGWNVIGPSGGDVRQIKIDPKNHDRLWVSTLDGQVYTSSDSGRSWTMSVNLNRPQLVLDQLIIDPRDSNVVYTSGHRHKLPGGFFKTTDGGATWKEAKELRNASIHAMEQSSKNPNMILAGTVEGIWRSMDSGESWKKIESTTMPINIDSLAIDPVDENIIYAGTWWRAYKTTDGGRNWRLIKEGMIDDSDVFAITIDPRDNNHIIASACSGIYESFNKGEKWTKIQGIPSQARRTRDILQHPTTAGTVYAGTTEGFWLTVDGGKRWAMTTQKDLEINSIAVHPDEPNRVYIGTNNYGVMVSTDGGRNFAQANGNFTSRFTYTLNADVERPGRMYATTHNTATGGGFFFISDDGGTTWKQPRNYDVIRNSPYALIQDRRNPNLMYLGTTLGIMKSLDRGYTWTRLTAPKRPAARKPAASRTKPGTVAPKPATTFVAAIDERVKALAYTEDGKSGILAGTDQALYRSYEVAKGWERIDFGAGLKPNIYAIHMSPLMAETIFVGTERSGLLVSRDSGKTWETAPTIPRDVPISSIASDPKRPENIYVGTLHTFYVSRDGGRTWTRRGGNLPLGNFTSILINPRNTDEIFLGSALEADGGIYYSSDAGWNWRRVDSKEMRLPSRRVWSMMFDPADPDRIFAATHSSGVYRLERTPAAAVNNDLTRPRVSGNVNR